jgi:hypothetical protein
VVLSCRPGIKHPDSIKCGQFFDLISNCQLLIKDFAPRSQRKLDREVSEQSVLITVISTQESLNTLHNDRCSSVSIVSDYRLDDRGRHPAEENNFFL